MNREDIARLAVQAGLHVYESPDDFVAKLEHFASLVTIAEREKVADWMISRSYATGHGDTIEDLLDHLVWQASERR